MPSFITCPEKYAFAVIVSGTPFSFYRANKNSYIYIYIYIYILNKDDIFLTFLGAKHFDTVSEFQIKQIKHGFNFETHPKDLLVAAGTGGSEELLIAVHTVHLVLLFNKSPFSQRGVAVSTVELLRVPGHAHGHEERTSGRAGVKKHL